jgi:hypothetical protein
MSACMYVCTAFRLWKAALLRVQPCDTSTCVGQAKRWLRFVTVKSEVSSSEVSQIVLYRVPVCTSWPHMSQTSDLFMLNRRRHPHRLQPINPSFRICDDSDDGTCVVLCCNQKKPSPKTRSLISPKAPPSDATSSSTSPASLHISI